MATTFYDGSAVDQITRDLQIDTHHVRRSRTRFFKKSASIPEVLSAFPESARATLGERIRFEALRLNRRFDSAVDGASRLVFRNADGLALESVILRAATGRVALCVSSQIGCAAACEFCATGKMGIARNLTVPEILDQVVQANRLLADEGRRVRNIVFMGMGEPLHNPSNVGDAIAGLMDGRLFHHPASRILLSTVGIPDALLHLAKEIPAINYALSLHAAEQATREALIPLARRHPLDELRRVVREVNAIQPERRTVMIEYLMLRGMNDAPSHIAALINWCRGLRVHVNLIPYNPIEEAKSLEASPRSVIEDAGRRLKSVGIPTTIRYSMGGDIAAACGQLVRHENRSQALAAQARERRGPPVDLNQLRIDGSTTS